MPKPNNLTSKIVKLLEEEPAQSVKEIAEKLDVDL